MRYIFPSNFIGNSIRQRQFATHPNWGNIQSRMKCIVARCGGGESVVDVQSYGWCKHVVRNHFVSLSNATNNKKLSFTTQTIPYNTRKSMQTNGIGHSDHIRKSRLAGVPIPWMLSMTSTGKLHQYCLTMAWMMALMSIELEEFLPRPSSRMTA